MDRCRDLRDGVGADSECPNCQHPAGDHLYPSGLCMTCLVVVINELLRRTY